MTLLAPTTRLQRVAALDLTLHSNGEAGVRWRGQYVRVGPYGVAVLETFASPISFAEALTRLKTRARGAQAWMDLTATVVTLFKLGILRDIDTHQPQLVERVQSYAGSRIHVAMLDDQRRTTRFIEAIRETVQPSDVVVDLGTGTGVLAVAAAQAGAAHVFAIEASGIASVANAVFHANNVSDRVTLVRGWSTDISLPQRGDVLVSEMIGHEPLDERLLEVYRDARQRLLRPEARIIPQTLDVFAWPVQVPVDEEAKWRPSQQHIRRWQQQYGIDLTPFLDAAMRRRLRTTLPHDRAAACRRLAGPVAVLHQALDSLNSPMIDARHTLTIHHEGTLNGVLLAFVAQLSPGVQLSSFPEDNDETGHWGNRLVLLPNPRQVSVGTSVTLRYRHRTEDDGISVEYTD